MASPGGYTAETFGIRLSGEMTEAEKKGDAKGVPSCKVSEADRILQGSQYHSSRFLRLHEMVSNLFAFASRFGGVGLFALSLLDASFLFIPFGPDLLLIALVAQEHMLAPLFALIAAAGSVAGCVIIDAVSRKEGEKGLERLLSRRRIRFVTKRIRKSAPWALSIASVMPPPFSIHSGYHCGFGTAISSEKAFDGCRHSSSRALLNRGSTGALFWPPVSGNFQVQRCGVGNNRPDSYLFRGKHRNLL